MKTLLLLLCIANVFCVGWGISNILNQGPGWWLSLFIIPLNVWAAIDTWKTWSRME